MIKRPLALFSVVFVMILVFLMSFHNSVFLRNPVESSGDGRKQIAGFLQDDVVTVYGNISNYSYQDQYGQTTTEVILKDVHILLPLEEQSLDIVNMQDKMTAALLTESRWKKVTQNGQQILVYINKEETPSIGEQILISGKLSFFEAATNPGQFDAEKYYENRDILFAVKKASLLECTENKAWIRQGLKEFALKQEEIMDMYLPAAKATIIKAMLLGNKKELDEEIKGLYQDNGIAHVLAISGLHISLLGMSLYQLLKRLPIPGWLALTASEIFLLLYGCMVGFPISSIRAIGMFTFFLISKLTKRSYDMLTALAFMAVIQLLQHPGYLFDCGFQLSYGAILGIGILLPAFEKMNETISNPWIAKGISYLLPSLSVTMVTAPIMVFHYHELSFFSILLNVIVLPFMSALLLSAIAMLCFAHLFVPLAKLCTVPVVGILGFYEYSCRFLELLPIGQKNVAAPSICTLILYYSLLFAMTVLVNKKRNWHHFLFAVAASVLLLFPRTPGFSVWMLDVGQGDCSVIFTKEGHCFVIDCGSTSKYNVGDRILIPFLKYHGVGKVDGVFVTHADADHMNGVLELLEYGVEENINIACVFLYEKALESEPEKWEELVILSKQNDVPIKGIGQGDQIQTESIQLECLYPLKEQSGLSGNSSSLVLSLEAEENVFRGLFTGDLETDGEKIFLTEYGAGIAQAEEESAGLQSTQAEDRKDGYDLLKVGHHGSSGSSSEEFLKWAVPQYAFISCGKNNSYGHPHAETLERLETTGSKIFSTAECGAISIEPALEIEVKSWCSSDSCF